MAEVSSSQHTGVIAAGELARCRFLFGANARLVVMLLSVRCAEAAPTDAQLDGSVRVCVRVNGYRTILDTFAPLVHRGGVATLALAGEFGADGTVEVDVSDAQDRAGVAMAVRASVTIVANEPSTHAPRW